MPFREDFPDYESYQDGLFYYTKVPSGVVAPLKGVILQLAESTQHLRTICNDIASRVPCEPTQNMGWDWLVNDLHSVLERVIRKKMYKFMDFISDLACDHAGTEFVEQVNEIFNAYRFGYRIIPADSSCGDRYCWGIQKTPE